MTNKIDDEQRYMLAMHAVQSGIAMLMQLGGEDARFTETKHLRVGIDSAHVSHLALAELLIARGVFTRAEYLGALADAAEDERIKFEGILTKRLGRQVILS